MEIQKEIYKEEAYELLAELESSLLELEETPDNKELIGRVFRAMHTIKGSGAMQAIMILQNLPMNLKLYLILCVTERWGLPENW